MARLDWIKGGSSIKGAGGSGKGNGRSNRLLKKSEDDDTNMRDSCEQWAKLPEYMMDMIFTSLPLDAVCNLRSVCKEWKALFSSEEFVMFWHQILSNRSPWLLLFEKKHFIAYCFSTNTCKTISLSFMLGPGEEIYYCEGSDSGSGLVLLSTTTNSASRENYKLWVCNPLRQIAFQVPVPYYIGKGNIVMQEDGSYNVSLVDYETVSIYCSSSDDFEFDYSPPVPFVSTHCALLYKDFVCSLTYGDTPGVNIISISGDSTSFVPLPDTFPYHSREDHSPWLLQYGSSLLLVAATFLENDQILENVLVWQLEMDKFLWKEFARMPSSICQAYSIKNEGVLDMQVVVVGDHLCCSERKCEDVLICNLMESSWTWVSFPKCHVSHRTMEALNPMCSLGNTRVRNPC